MKIVPISESDWEDLKVIRLASLKESPEAFGVSYQQAIEYTPIEWKLRASDKGGPRFFIAYLNENPVGLIGGILTDGEYELISMWVSPENRGEGIGRYLVESLKEHASKEGHSSVILSVSPENKPAYHLYRRCGFRRVGEAGGLSSNPKIQLVKMIWSQA